MESRAISPSETALPYAYAQLAPSDAVEEYRSGAGVRWRAFVAVLAASAVVVLLPAGGQRAGRVQQGGEGRGRRCGGGRAAAGARSRGRDASVRVGEDLWGGDRDGVPRRRCRRVPLEQSHAPGQRTGRLPLLQPERNWMNGARKFVHDQQLGGGGLEIFSLLITSLSINFDVSFCVNFLSV